MKKISMVALRSDMDKILKVFQLLGSVEAVEYREDNDEAAILNKDTSDRLASYEDELTKISQALNSLRPFNGKKKPLGYKHSLSVEAAVKLQEKKDKLLDVITKCREIEDKFSDIRSRTIRINNLYNQIEPWKDLDVPFVTLKDTKETRILIGTAPMEASERFENPDERLKEVYVKKVGEGKDNNCYFVVFHKDLDAEMSNFFKETGFNKVNFASIDEKPSEALKNFSEELELLEKQRSNLQDALINLAEHIYDLEVLYDLTILTRDRELEIQKLANTRNVFFLKGYVPAKEMKRLLEKLKIISDCIKVDFEDIKRDEVYPVAFSNHPLIRPFEMITKLYSMPNHTSMDTNLHMAPFFFTFFGIMLGDAAYGIIMAILGFYFTKKLRLKGDAARMGLLVAYLGIATFIWGTFFGSWFGDAGARLGITPILFDPMRNPIYMLVLCFGLGIIQLFTGMAIKAWINIKRGLILDAIFDQGLWYVFLIGLMLLATPLSGIAGYMAIGGAIGLVLTQGRSQKSIVGKLVSGLLALYNTSGYLSDVLSYSRLFALGLATAVIGMVFNQLGVMLGASWITFLFAVVVLIIGHVFNIAVSALGAYVHASRLQYIEFFGKFFEGGGRAFRPLNIKTKFTEILEEEAI